MKFRTELKTEHSELRLDPKRPITLIGSCFAENIGKKMQESMWEAYINPTGVLYNPYSIGEATTNCLLPRDMKEELVRKTLTRRDDMYVSWLFDSSICGKTPEECVKAGADALDRLYDSLMKSQAVIVTWGSANVYRHSNSNYGIVANCHKHPASEFHRSRLTVNDIVTWNQITSNTIDSRLGDTRVILTVSPVRYLADGLVESNRSKSVLILAAEQVVKDMQGQIEYFPAYELVTDDLRDYRFYDTDLCHPSETAIDYVWEKFKEQYIDAEGQRWLKEGASLHARINHKPLMPGSEADVRFRQETERLLQKRNEELTAYQKSLPPNDRDWRFKIKF